MDRTLFARHGETNYPRAVLIVLLACAVALLYSVPTALAGVSAPQRVTDNNRPDYAPDIAVDGAGFSHLVWSQEITLNNEKIFYADNKTGGWQVRKISNGGDDDLNAQIAVDSNGTSHVVWWDFDNSEIYYRNNQGGDWSTTQNVSQDANNSFDPKIAVDSGDNVHVTWYDATDGKILYRKRTAAGNWVDWYYIDPTGSVDNSMPEIAVDSAGRPHLVWESLMGEWCLVYANYNGATWTLDKVTSDADGEVVDEEYEICVDSNRKPHVTYGQHDVGQNADIFYAVKTDGGFSRTNVTDDRSTNDLPPALDLDSNNKAHIAWTKESPLWNLNYVTNASGQFGDAVKVSRSSETINKLEPRLEVDSVDIVHICWWERYAVDGGVPSADAPVTFTYESMYTNNAGGGFDAPSDLGMGVLKGFKPDMAIGPNNYAHMGFIGNTGTGENDYDIFYSMGAGGGSAVWYLAEGSTGGTFETWVLVQNPNDEEANVTITYMTPGGEIAGPSTSIPANSRETFNVATHAPGQDSVSTKVTSDVGVIAERAMYWNNRMGGHDSIGYQ